MKSYKKFLKKNTYCIFLLHGIIPDNFTSEVRNYNRKHIFLSEYINFIDEMLELGNPLSIHDIVSHHVEKTPIPEYSFCISFLIYQYNVKKNVRINKRVRNF